MIIQYTLVVLSTVLPTETEHTTMVPTETELTTTGKGSHVFLHRKRLIYTEISCEKRADDIGNGIPDGFLCFGTAQGDSVVPRADDGSSNVITLTTDVVIFGSSHSRLYVS